MEFWDVKSEPLPTSHGALSSFRRVWSEAPPPTILIFFNIIFFALFFCRPAGALSSNGDPFKLPELTPGFYAIVGGHTIDRSQIRFTAMLLSRIDTS